MSKLWTWVRSYVHAKRVQRYHLDALGGIFNRPAGKVYSFDVFDTVLARVTATHLGIFALMQQRLLDHQSDLHAELARNFLSWRASAEDKADSLYQKGCPLYRKGCRTLDDIYQPLVSGGVISVEGKAFLLQMETMLEYENCYGIPRIVELIQALRSKRGRIVFVSDMYLSSLQIRQMLGKANCFQEGDQIYVSCEHNATKADGTLYDVVTEREGVRPKDIIHIGNNYYVDILQARRKGIRAVYFNSTDLNHHERQLQLYRSGDWRENGGDGEILAGTAKRARLLGVERRPYEKAVYDLGASFAGPVLIAFVLWTLLKARERGVERLYFVARDGQILHQIAQKVIRRVGFDIELRYLYGSRHAWFLPAITDVTDYEVDWLTLHRSFLSLKIVARRIGLEAEFLKEHFERLTGTTVDVDENVVRLEREVKGLLSSPEVKARILDVAAQKRPQVVGYLRQEGLLDDVPFSLVDVGWRGTMQKALVRMIESVQSGRDRIHGMYFSLDLLEQDTTADESRLVTDSFSSREGDPVHWRVKDILEFVCSADHGFVLGYRLKQGSYSPEFKVDVKNDVEAWGVGALQEGIHRFVDCLLERKDFDLAAWNVEEFRRTITGLCDQLIDHTTRMEAEVIGRYPFKWDSAESFVEEYAPRFSLLEAFEQVVYPERQLSKWLRATHLRSSFAVKVLLKVCEDGRVQRMLRSIKPLVRFRKREPGVMSWMCVAVPEWCQQVTCGL